MIEIGYITLIKHGLSQFRSGIDIECPYLWSYGKREKRRKHETRRQQDEDVDGDLRDAMPRLQVGAIIISYHY
jgi:hypothetical protein